MTELIHERYKHTKNNLGDCITVDFKIIFSLKNTKKYFILINILSSKSDLIYSTLNYYE